MSTNAIAGNQNFTKVDNTLLSQSDLLSAQAGSGLATVYAVSGKAALTTATGNFAVQDSAGDTLQLPSGALVQAVYLSQDSNLVPAAGTTLQAVLSATDGGGAGTALHGAYTPGGTFVSNAPTITALTGSATDVFVSVTVGTAGATTAGNLNVVVHYVVAPQ